MTFAEFISGILPQPHTIAVATHLGRDDDGDTYAAAVQVTPVYVEQRRRIVDRTTRLPTAQQVMSTVTIYADIAESVVLPQRSRVTIADGTTMTVESVLIHDAAGTGLPSHVEVLCA